MRVCFRIEYLIDLCDSYRFDEQMKIGKLDTGNFFIGKYIIAMLE